MRQSTYLLVVSIFYQVQSWPVSKEDQAFQPDSQKTNNQEPHRQRAIGSAKSNTKWGIQGMGLPPQGALELMRAQQIRREQETQPSIGEEIKSGLQKLDPGFPTEKPFREETKEWLERTGETIKSGYKSLKDQTSSAADTLSQQAQEVKNYTDQQTKKLRQKRQISEEIKDIISRAGERVKGGIEKAAEHGEKLKETIDKNLGEEGRHWMEEQSEKVKEGFSAVKDAAMEKADVLSKSAATAQSASTLHTAANKLGEATADVREHAAHKAESVIDQAVGMMKEAGELIRQSRDTSSQEAVDKTSEAIEEGYEKAQEWIKEQTLKLREGYFVLRKSMMEKAGELTEKVVDAAGTVKEKASETAQSVSEDVKKGASKPIDETRDTMKNIAAGIRQKRQTNEEEQTDNTEQHEDQSRGKSGQLFTEEEIRQKAKPTSQWGNKGALLPPQGGLELMFMQQKAREWEEQPSLGEELKSGMKKLDPGFNTERPIGESIKGGWDSMTQKAKDVGTGVKQKAEQVGDTIKETASDIQGRGSQAVESVKQGTENIRQQTRSRRQILVDDEVLEGVLVEVTDDEPDLLLEGPFSIREEPGPIEAIASPIEIIADETDVPVSSIDVILPLKKRQADANIDIVTDPDKSEQDKSVISFEEGQEEDKVNIDMSAADQKPWPSSSNPETNQEKRKRQTIIFEDENDYDDSSYRSSQITIDSFDSPYTDLGQGRQYQYQEPYPYYRKKRESMINLAENARKQEASREIDVKSNSEPNEDDRKNQHSETAKSMPNDKVASHSSVDSPRDVSLSSDEPPSSLKKRNSEEFQRKKRFGLGFGPYNRQGINFGFGIGGPPVGGGLFGPFGPSGGVIIEEGYDPSPYSPYGDPWSNPWDNQWGGSNQWGGGFPFRR